MTRNSWEVGDYLMIDAESGMTHLASERVRQWDGSWRHYTNVEQRHPQDFVKARNDPQALQHVAPLGPQPDTFNALLITVGDTTVPAPYGPASHLYDLAIPDMAVGYSMVVR